MQLKVVDITLDGSWKKPGGPQVLPPHPDVLKFPNEHPTAKIIIVIDTHCFQESGGFVWAEPQLGNPQGCTLWEVGR